MNQLNFKKLIIVTSVKIALMLGIIFIYHNRINFIGLFKGENRSLNEWMETGFTRADIIPFLIVSVLFFYKSLKHQQDHIKKRASYLNS